MQGNKKIKYYLLTIKNQFIAKKKTKQNTVNYEIFKSY